MLETVIHQTPQIERTTMKPYSQTSLMKRLQTAIAVLSVAACGAGIANANDLINPDLDNIAVGPQLLATPVGWQILAYKSISGAYTDGASSEGFCNVQQPSGYGLFFKQFAGSTNLVNDLISVYFFQDNPSAPGAKATLSGYAATDPNFAAYLPIPAGAPQAQALFVVEFLDNGNNVISSNALDLVAAGLQSTSIGSISSSQFTTPQYTAPAGTVAVRVGAFMLNGYNTSGGQAFCVDAFDLEQIAPAGAPVITNQPANTTALLGSTVTLKVGVSNPVGCSYIWQFEGVDLVNGGGVSGATSPTLTLTGTTTNNVGHYRVKVTNATAPAVSQTVLLALNTFNFYPVVPIYGVLGSRYVLSYSTTVNGTYTPLSTNTLTTSPQFLIDSTSAGNNTRFYQATFLP